MVSIRSSASYPLSASTASVFKPSNSDLAWVISATSPPVSSQRTGLPSASTTTRILLVHPPRERPIACGPSFFWHQQRVDVHAPPYYPSSAFSNLSPHSHFHNPASKNSRLSWAVAPGSLGLPGNNGDNFSHCSSHSSFLTSCILDPYSFKD